MTDFISAVFDNLILIFEENPWLRVLFTFCVSVWLFFICIRMIARLIDPYYELDFFDPLVTVCRWLKDKFIDILAKFVPGETLYKWGLARLGKEYVECDTQDCSTCPFVSNCKSPANGAGDNN